MKYVKVFRREFFINLVFVLFFKYWRIFCFKYLNCIGKMNWVYICLICRLIAFRFISVFIGLLKYLLLFWFNNLSIIFL